MRLYSTSMKRNTSARAAARLSQTVVPISAFSRQKIGVGGVSLTITDDCELSGIALGTIVVITGYHVLRAFAPAHLKPQEPLLDAGTSTYDDTKPPTQ